MGLALGMAILIAPSLGAQRNAESAAVTEATTTTVAAGERYRAGPLKSFLFGSGYRDLWATPITVPYLSPDTFAGGLEVLERGGGRQTASLRLGARDGREFVFRSVDKDQSGGFHEDLRDGLIDDIVQDQVSAKHPGAAVVVAPLLAAAGVLHASPRMAVMVDHPLLGEHREEFAGMLGIIEARPTEDTNAGRFGDFENIIGTDRLLERIVETSRERVDSRAYLTARLMDLLIGDWDRHADQWRWAEVQRDSISYWLPIPRDRDNAFYSVEGMLGTVGGMVRPFVLQYEETYPDLYGLTYNARGLDRRFLPILPLATWDSVALDLQRKLTDEVIATAVRMLPEPYYQLSGEDLAWKLRSRRDALPTITREFYDQIVRDADIYGTDEPDRVDITRHADGTVEVVIRPEEGPAYLQRVFSPHETDEVRLHTLAGDDSVTVAGGGPAYIVVRVVGGEGDDQLADQAEGRGLTVFYDDTGENEFVTAANTVIDVRSFVPPARDTLTQNNLPPPRQSGTHREYVAPMVGWQSEVGPVITLGPRRTEFGFRRLPHASQTSLRLTAAPLHGRFAAEASMYRVRTGGDRATRLVASASQLGLTRFHGFGNETPGAEEAGHHRIWFDEYRLSAELLEMLSTNTHVYVGPTVSYIDPDALPAGAPADIERPLGTASYGLAGLRSGATYDNRDSESFTRDGAFVELAAEWYPLLWDGAESPFFTTSIAAAMYQPLPLPLQSNLALRAGGQTVWGDAPVQFAPKVGGSSTLRGYRTSRFHGDASLFGSAELRNRLGRANLLLTRGDFGSILLADAGRVFLEEEASDRWHSALGGGLWFSAVDGEYTFHVVAAKGERWDLSAGFGLPF